jgi:hypothetical protein
MGIVISTRIGGMGAVGGGGGKGEELDTLLGGDMCDMWVCGDGDCTVPLWVGWVWVRRVRPWAGRLWVSGAAVGLCDPHTVAIATQGWRRPSREKL